MICRSGEIFGKDIILPHFIVNLSKPSSLGGGGMNYLCLPMIKVGFSEGCRNIFLFLLEI